MKNVALDIIGGYLFLDGLGSVLFVKDKRVFWQVGRVVRMILGIVIIVL